jgi:hypothetical protein
LRRIAYQNEDTLTNRLKICSWGKNLVLMLSLILVTIAVQSIESSSLSIMNNAWGSDDENDNVPLANGMPTEDLYVKCENRKNVIQGGGIIVGTNHEGFIHPYKKDSDRNNLTIMLHNTS